MTNYRRMVLIGAALTGGLLGLGQQAFAQGKGLEEPFRADYYKKLEGKTVAYLPVAMSFDLAQGWITGVKKELDPLGVKVEIRDPNWSTNAGAQALSTLINEKPDVIIVHNPGRSNICKAAAEGGRFRHLHRANQYAIKLRNHSIRRRRLGRGGREGH